MFSDVLFLRFVGVIGIRRVESRSIIGQAKSTVRNESVRGIFIDLISVLDQISPADVLLVYVILRQFWDLQAVFVDSHMLSKHIVSEVLPAYFYTVPLGDHDDIHRNSPRCKLKSDRISQPACQSVLKPRRIICICQKHPVFVLAKTEYICFIR